MELVTADDLRKSAYALMPYIASVVKNPADQESILQSAIDSTVAELEEDLETRFETTVIRQTTPADGDVYDEIEAPFNYHSGSLRASRLPSFTLRRRPVLSIQRAVFQFNNVNRVMEVPESWWKVNHRLGTFTFIPLGLAEMMTQDTPFSHWALALFSSNLQSFDLPQFFAVDYTAGWYDPEGTELPREAAKLREGILHAARLHLCREAMGIVPSSSSAGGVSQSFTPIEKQIEVLEKEVQGFKDWWSKHYRPPRVVML